jgi:hypothetical protein
MNRLQTRRTRLVLECHKESSAANNSGALGEYASFIASRMELSPLRWPIELLPDLTRDVERFAGVAQEIQKGEPGASQ